MNTIQHIPPLDTRSLLPPFLACLATASISSSPPPALLPLLSPILRQRVQLLAATAASSPAENWLPLLCWDPAEASKLAHIIENTSFEPHPISSEFEFEEIEGPLYRRLDDETLQSKVTIADIRLAAVYLWCQGDHEGGGDGWRVSELNPADEFSGVPAEQGVRPWFSSVSEANNRASGISAAGVRRHNFVYGSNGLNGSGTHQDERNGDDDDDDDDDDDYWARYDNTPARTPATKRSPALTEPYDRASHHTATSEAEYYSQYAQVQPAMDNHDPSEVQAGTQHSSLDGNAVIGVLERPWRGKDNIQSVDALPNGFNTQETIIHTRPSSSASSSAAIARLESSAATQSHGEIAIQQHISTSMKSLFRLARATGMGQEEFERLVKIELDTLSMMTDDD